MSLTTPQLGKTLPHFQLPAAVPSPDGSIAEVLLTPASFNGRPWVLFFYPRDATSGCTIEVCGFRDLHPHFTELGAEVVGVSRDDLRAHHRFINSQQLPYGLASDAGGEMMKQWGLLLNKTMYGKPVTKVARTTFVIDAQGKLVRLFEKVTPLGHAREVLESIQAIADGEA